MLLTLEKIAELFVFLPLLPFAFIPVKNWITTTKNKFLLNLTIISSLYFLTSFFMIYFLQIADINCLILILLGSFLWFYIKEVSLNIYIKLFWFFTTCLLGCFSVLFAVTIDAYLHPMMTFSDFSWIRIFTQIIFIIIADILFYYPVNKYYTWIFENFDSAKVWKIIWNFPVVLIIISLILIPRHFDFVLRYRYFRIYISILILFFMLIIIIYILMYRTIYSFVKNKKIEQENQLLSIQANQYHQLLSYVQETRRLRHDFKHQMIVISELLNQKEYKKMEEYIQASALIVSSEIIQYSSSAAINAVLSHYDALCKDRKIKTDFKIALPEELPISEIDLCMLLGNLLENAFDACQKMNNAYITLKLAQTSPSIFALKISNPYQNQIIKKNNHFLSTKHSGQGLGIESVKVIAKRYNGLTDIHYEDHVFSVKVLLKF